MKRFFARGLSLGLALLSAPAWAASADLGSQVTAGKQLFETTCAASTCHGSGGVGAGGPKLVDRNFALDFVRTTVANGRSGTAMPAFKELFDPDMMASVIAYVLTISTGGRWATAVPVEQTAKADAAAPWPQSVAIGAAQGSPAAGYALFYDATSATACRTCHSYRENGGPVGRDLSTLNKSAPDVFALMSKSVATESVAVTLRSGAKHAGVKAPDAGDAVRIIDVSALPPVTRSFAKVDVVAVEPTDVRFDHGALSYTPQNLRDAAVFLSSGARK